jgi:endonuclease/exonuclease/phosphatase family metal-dependent hydrolase
MFYFQPAYAPLLKQITPHQLFNYGELKRVRPRLFRVLTYNIWMLPNVLTNFMNVSHSKEERAHHIVQNLLQTRSDVVVFTEAFDNKTREFIIQRLRMYGYYYETPCLGAFGKYGAINGGIVIVSRYQIIESQQRIFSESCNDDSLSNKGILYAKLLCNTTYIHIFGVHMQAWDSGSCSLVRKKQLAELKQMSKDISCGLNDIVLFVGDLNINRYDNHKTNEYDYMLETLDVTDLLHANIQATINPFDNSLARGQTISNDGVPELIDYILHVRNTGTVSVRNCGVLPFKANKPYRYKNALYSDLSDHYPIFADLEILS